MANITNYCYQFYEWHTIHSVVEQRCIKVRERFLSDMRQRSFILREDIVREYVSDNTLLSIQCIPTNEIIALLQWCEMRNEVNDVYHALVFDAVCNLWNYLSEYDVREYKKKPIENQLDYVARKKTEFLGWYSKNRKITIKESQILVYAIHMPTYHRVTGHELLDVMISYLLC